MTVNVKYRILTCDGGGIRGVLTAKLLSMLEHEVPFIEKVDLFAGTSTGSFIALALNWGYSPHDLVDLYVDQGAKIFNHSRGIKEAVDLKAKYVNAGLKQLLDEKIFPNDPTLADLKKKIVVPAFALKDEELGFWSPIYFDNFDEERAKSLKIADVALRSSAAPIYFPSYQGFIDGGVVANNPSMLTLAKALDPTAGHQPIDQVRLLSLGTGFNPASISENIDWGAIQWVVKSPLPSPPTPHHPLLAIMWDGINDVPHYQCSQILNDQYRRLCPKLKQAVAMDNTNDIELLLEAAEQFPAKNPEVWNDLINWIKREF